jgi:hypothetical protein
MESLILLDVDDDGDGICKKLKLRDQILLMVLVQSEWLPYNAQLTTILNALI